MTMTESPPRQPILAPMSQEDRDAIIAAADAREFCEHCGGVYKNHASLRAHQRAQHPEVTPLLRRPAGEGKPRRSRAKAKPVALPVDGIVQSVLMALYPSGQVPIEHLPLIEQYRIDTAKFVKAVSS